MQATQFMHSGIKHGTKTVVHSQIEISPDVMEASASIHRPTGISALLAGCCSCVSHLQNGQIALKCFCVIDIYFKILIMGWAVASFDCLKPLLTLEISLLKRSLGKVRVKLLLGFLSGSYRGLLCRKWPDLVIIDFKTLGPLRFLGCRGVKSDFTIIPMW